VGSTAMKCSGLLSQRRTKRVVLAADGDEKRESLQSADASTNTTLRGLKAKELTLQRQLDAVRRRKHDLLKSQRMRIGIVGFGPFGQFLAKTFSLDSDVFAMSRSDHAEIAERIGVRKYLPFSSADAFFELGLDVCVIAVSIVSFEDIIKELAPHMAGRRMLVVDVLSVKEYPRTLLLEHVPTCCDLLATHPMFGPQSGGGPSGWQGLTFMFDVVRSSRASARRELLEMFLLLWEGQGCRMVRMTCADHDRYSANSQFMTHLIGRILGEQQLVATPIDTKGFQSLLNVLANTNADSFDLFLGLFKYNSNSCMAIANMRRSFDRIVNALEEASGGKCAVAFDDEPTEAAASGWRSEGDAPG